MTGSTLLVETYVAREDSGNCCATTAGSRCCRGWVYPVVIHYPSTCHVAGLPERDGIGPFGAQHPTAPDNVVQETTSAPWGSLGACG